MNRFLGLTLIEVMMAIFLNSLILMFLTTIFLTSKKNDDAEFSFMQLQDNIDMASNTLRDAIQQAGFMGCIKQASQYKIEPYQGYELKPDTEGITILGANVKSAVLMETMQNLQVLLVSKDQKFSLNDTVVISDCLTTEIFTIKDIQEKNNNQVIVSENPLSKFYEKHAEVSLFEKKSFFVSKTTRTNINGLPIYALYVKNNQGKSELIENVLDMQIRYGVLDHNILKELKAEEISDWSGILGASVALLFSTFNFKKYVYVYAALRE